MKKITFKITLSVGLFILLQSLLAATSTSSNPHPRVQGGVAERAKGAVKRAQGAAERAQAAEGKKEGSE